MDKISEIEYQEIVNKLLNDKDVKHTLENNKNIYEKGEYKFIDEFTPSVGLSHSILYKNGEQIYEDIG